MSALASKTGRLFIAAFLLAVISPLALDATEFDPYWMEAEKAEVSKEVKPQLDNLFTAPAELLGATCLVPRPPEEVRAGLDGLIEKYPDEPGLYLERSRARYALSDFNKAEEDLEAYVQKSQDKAGALQDLVDFYGQRLLAGKKLEAFKRLFAALSENPQENKERLFELINNMFNHADSNLLEIDKAGHRRNLVDLYPDDHEAALLYLEERFETADYKKLAEEIKGYAEKFREERAKFLELLARLHDKNDNREAARRVFTDRLSPYSEKEMFFTYCSLLEKWRDYKYTKRKLREKKEAFSDLDRALLFHMYLRESERGKAKELLEEWTASSEKHSPEMIALFADYAVKCEGHEKSARLLYSHMPRVSEENKPEWLYKLFLSLLESRTSAWPVPGGISGLYQPRLLDPHQGISGGVLSLLVNGKEPAQAFHDLAVVEGRHRNLERAITVRNEYQRLFPNGAHNPEMDFRLIENLEDLDFLKRAVAEADSFISSYPRESRLVTVKRKRAKALFRLDRYDQAIAQYDELLAETGPDRELFLDILQEYGSRLDRENMKRKKLEVYWREVELHPQMEGVYELLLNALGSKRYMGEKLRLYKSAVKNLKGADWHSRLARWYIRKDMKKEYRKVLAEAVSVLPPSELVGYVEGAVPHWMDEWSKVRASLYLAAHRRFPRRLEYTRKYLKIMENLHENTKCMSVPCRLDHIDLAKHVLMDDPRLGGAAGKIILDKMVQSQMLDEAVRTLEDRSGLNPAEEYFLAMAFDRKARYETSPSYWRSLAKRYPATAWFKTSLADRLLGLSKVRPSRFGNSWEEAADLLKGLASLYPADMEYPERIGRIYIEHGRSEEALAWWDKLIDQGPGDDHRYLKAADLAYGYFQYEAAVERIRRCRDTLSAPRLYSLELGAILEDMGKREEAIVEYIRGLAQEKSRVSFLTNRLVRLAEEEGEGKYIASEFEKHINKDPGAPAPVRAYAGYLEKLEGKEDKMVSVLSRAFEKVEDREFLLWGKNKLEAIDRPESALQAVESLVSLYNDDFDIRLEAVRFYKHNDMGRRLKAEAEDLRVEISDLQRPEDKIRRLHALSRVLWEAKEYPEAKEALRTALSLAQGKEYYELSEELADKLIEIKSYSEAAGVLSAALEKKGWDAGIFKKLARAYTYQKSSSSLIYLHQDMKEMIEEDASGREERRTKLSLINKTIADSLSHTDRKKKTLDYYIEWINQGPVEMERARTAWSFAVRNGLTSRLIDYYDKTAQKAHKDFRWSLVLARLQAWNNGPEKAVAAYELAIRNEPGKEYLYREAVPLLRTMKKYNEAARMYNSLSELKLGSLNEELSALRMYFLAGDTEKANAKASAIMEDSERNGFKVAREFEKAGDPAGALPVLARALEFYLDNADDYRISRNDLADMVRIYGKAGRIREAIWKLEVSYDRALSMKRGISGLSKWDVKSLRKSLEDSLDDTLGMALVEWGTPSDFEWAEQWLQDKAAEDEVPLEVLYDFAEGAGFSDQAHGLLTKLQNKYEDGEWLKRLRDVKEDSEYMPMFSSKEKDLVDYIFFRERLQWERAYQAAQRMNEEDDDSRVSGEEKLVRRLYSMTPLLWMGRESRFLAEGGELYSRDILPSSWEEQLLDIMLRLDREEVWRKYLDEGGMERYEANFFLKRERPDLAERALESADSEAWSVAKILLVKIAEGDFDEEFEKRVRKTLRLHTAKERIERKWEKDSQLKYRDQAVVLMNFAEYLHRAGKRYDAEKIWYSALEESPGSYETYRFTGEFLLGLGENKEAAKMFQKGLDLSPQSLPLLNGLALAYKNNMERQKSLQTLDAMAMETPQEDQNSYRKKFQFFAMLNAGFESEAVSKIVTYVRAGYAGDDEKAKGRAFNALRSYASYACEKSPEGPPAQFSLLVGDLLKNNGHDVGLAKAVIENQWVGPEKLDEVYNHLIAALEEKDASGSVLRKWEKRRLEHWLSRGHYNKVVSVLNEQEMPMDLKEVPLANVKLRVRALLKNGMSSRARTYLNKWIEVKGESRSILDKVSAMYRTEGFDNEAAEVEQRKWDLALSDPLAPKRDHLDYADFLLEHEKNDEAHKVIDRLLYRFPDNSHVLEEAAAVLEKHGKTERAFSLRRTVMELDPSNTQNVIEAVLDLCRDKKADEAAKLVVKTLKSPVSPRSLRLRLPEALERRLTKEEGRLLAPELVSRLSSALKENSERRQSFLLARAVTEVLGGNPDSGLKDLDEAMSMGPATAAALACRTALSAGEFEKAENICRQGIKSFPLNARIRYRLALAFIKNDKADKALALALTGYDLAEARFLESFSSRDRRQNRIIGDMRLSYSEERELEKNTLTRHLLEKLLSSGLPSEEKLDLLEGMARYLEERHAYEAALHINDEVIDYLNPSAPHYYACSPCEGIRWRTCPEKDEKYSQTVIEFQKYNDRLKKLKVEASKREEQSLQIKTSYGNGMTWEDSGRRPSSPEKRYFSQ